jgi:hypothetical protein
VKYNLCTKDQGGLGIEIFEVKNKCVLSKWLFKLLNEENIWKELLKNKYLHSKSLPQVQAKPVMIMCSGKV